GHPVEPCPRAPRRPEEGLWGSRAVARSARPAVAARSRPHVQRSLREREADGRVCGVAAGRRLGDVLPGGRAAVFTCEGAYEGDALQAGAWAGGFSRGTGGAGRGRPG